MAERETAKNEASKRTRAVRERTCVGCGRHDDPAALVRLIVADDVLAFDLAGGAFGRGAYLHARPECLAKAPRGLARAFHRPPDGRSPASPEPGRNLGAGELGRLLGEACDRSMTGLLVTARRLGALAVGTDAAIEALGRGAPLLVLAKDAGAAIAARREVTGAVAEGRAVAWGSKGHLGALLGESAVAICAIRHTGIAARFRGLRAAADAAGGVSFRPGSGQAGDLSSTRGEGCSTEAR